jgi:hypothetical protein
MAGVCLLNGIDGERTNGIDTKLIEIWHPCLLGRANDLGGSLLNAEQPGEISAFLDVIVTGGQKPQQRNTTARHARSEVDICNPNIAKASRTETFLPG